MSRASILIYGRDRQLLNTRRLVLEHIGARVLVAEEVSYIAQVEPDKPIDLIILCHSLSKEQCLDALAQARTRWPHIQSLSLISGQYGCQPALADHIADTAKGPQELLRTVAMLIPSEPASPADATEPA